MMEEEVWQSMGQLAVAGREAATWAWWLVIEGGVMAVTWCLGLLTMGRDTEQTVL